MKKIIIGIDVSKEKLDVTAIDAEKAAFGVVEVGYQVFNNTSVGFRKMIVWAKNLRKGIKTDELLFCCETTGGYDHLLCDYLYTKDIDIWRECALEIKMSSGIRKGKNDKADSKAIAEYAMRHIDKVRLYKPLSQAVIDLKLLLLQRRHLEQERTSLKIRASEMKATHVKSTALTEIYRDSMKQVRDIEKRIKKFEKLILEVIKSDEQVYKNYKHLISIKSIGIINATTFIVYTNNFENFQSGRQMASYWGVASFRNQSGTSIDKRAYVKQLSNSMLKAYITQAAECAIQRNGIYHDYYMRLRQRGKIHGIAVNNVKNKLVLLAFTLVSKDQDYEYNHEEVRSALKRMPA